MNKVFQSSVLSLSGNLRLGRRSSVVRSSQVRMVKKPFSQPPLVLSRAEKVSVAVCCKKADGDDGDDGAAKVRALLILVLKAWVMSREEEEAKKKKKRQEEEDEAVFRAWYAAEMIKEEEDEKNKNQEEDDEREEEDEPQKIEEVEAVAAYRLFSSVMQKKVPRSKEARKGFSVFEARFWRTCAHYATTVLPNYNYVPAGSKGTIYASFRNLLCFLFNASTHI